MIRARARHAERVDHAAPKPGSIKEQTLDRAATSQHARVDIASAYVSPTAFAFYSAGRGISHASRPGKQACAGWAPHTSSSPPQYEG
jgi:hypothetical protein